MGAVNVSVTRLFNSFWTQSLLFVLLDQRGKGAENR